MAKRSAKKKKNGKKDPYKKLTPEQKQYYIFEAADNDYTRELSQDRQKILYTGEFYYRMNELLESGMTAVEAYEACGYDTKKLGKNRANLAAARAREFVANKESEDWRNYSGVESLDAILKEKNPAVRESKHIAKVKILETMDEVQKKILPEFMAKYMASDEKKKQ